MSPPQLLLPLISPVHQTSMHAHFRSSTSRYPGTRRPQHPRALYEFPTAALTMHQKPTGFEGPKFTTQPGSIRPRARRETKVADCLIVHF